MTTTAHEDQFTDAPEPVRQPYDTGSVLRRNVADLEIALKQQAERAEAAEAELARLREQTAVAQVEVTHGFHKRTTNWLKALPDGTHLLFTGPVPAPAVPDGDDFNGTTPHLILCMEALVRLDADGVLVPHGIGRDASKLLSAAANRLRKQPAPSVPEDWWEAMQEAHDTFQRYADLHQAKGTHDGYKKAKANQKLANKLYALLQSRAVKDSLTAQADCRACVNRGRVNGLSQETYCESCIWQGMSWRKDHHAPVVPDANPVQWLADEGDMILVPRGLLGAACSSIDKQRPAPKVLEALRYYTMNAPQAPAVPELDPMTRLIVSDPKQLKPKKQEPAVPRKYHEFASVMLDAQPFITAETYGGRYIVAMRFERLGKMQDCHAALLALLQSPAVNDSLTSQADCRACVNRGRVNGLSQETYCESCVHEGRNWRKNHFLDAAGQRLLEGGE